MTSSLGALGTVLGLAALAGLLYFLQRLRVRQRVVVVETTMFWRQALEDSRARTLVERFRHPWAYAFLLLIASLLWLALADLRPSKDGGTTHVVLLDASALMSGPGRLEEALGVVEDFLETVEDEARSVVYCGGRARTVLLPGEDRLLLRERVGKLRAEASPPTIEAALHTALASKSGDLRVVIAGDARLASATEELLPADVEVTHLRLPSRAGLAPSDKNNDRQDEARSFGITALGCSEAQSGAWDRVDVLVEVYAVGREIPPKSTAPDAPRVAIDAKPLEREAEVHDVGDGLRQFVYRDLAARGGVFTASVGAQRSDLVPLDDRAQIVLPDRRTIAVSIEAGLPDALALAIDSDPALRRVANGADIVLRRSGSSFGGNAPRVLEFSKSAEAPSAISITCAPSEEPEQIVRELYAHLGLDEIDAARLARAQERIVTMTAQRGSARSIAIWESLLSSDFDFVQSRAFPLFCALAIRWICEDWVPPQSLRVGSPIALGTGPIENAAGTALPSLGDAFTPARAGTYRTASGQRIEASLLDRKVSAHSEATDARVEEEPGGTWMPLRSLLAIVALVLLCLEWQVYRRGRMP